MPAIAPPATILVTGSNGYIGAWIVKVLLDRGFAVRAAVRSLPKATPLQEALPEFVENGRLTFVAVEDILKDGAFDEALEGVEGVMHLASPVAHPEPGCDPETFLRPAIKGTTEILQGALKDSQSGKSNLKRIIVTSSTAAVFTPLELGAPPRVFTDADWNDAAVADVREKGKDAVGMMKYRASKVLAERAAWDIYNTHKSEIAWDLVVINPPWVFGPPLTNFDSPDALGASMKMFYQLAIAPGPKPREHIEITQAFVDVRDLAESHARALETEGAGGERIVVSSESYVFQQWLDIANAVNKQLGLGRNLPVGYPDLTEGEIIYPVQYDTSKEKRLLGTKHRSKEETTTDILKWLQTKGW